MKLKRLDIHGFKSFYHRTTLAFDAGVTAVVGPNGCGKSNIVDAIKWVMGEQGARALRGNAMEDVVFAGSERRGPMGMCEVRLTFANDGSAEVPARWRDVPELAVERRLERSKGSDYFINKQRCRLADVQELVAGTGVGSGPGGQRAYAIIEQGQIGRIVSAKADERRLLIEEAAGITRYRARKKVAERKMAETRLNLDRLLDVVGEVAVRLKSLERQARKAERYQAYRAEADGIERRVALAALRAAEAAFAMHRAATEAVAEREAVAAGALEAAEAAEAAALAEVEAAALEARARGEALSAAERAASEARGRVDALSLELRGLEAQLAALRDGEDDGGAQAEQLRAELEATDAQLAALAGEAEAERGALDEVEAQRAAAHRAVLDARATAERLRREAAEEAHAVARARAQHETALRHADEVARRLATLNAEAERLAGEVASSRQALAEAEQAREAAERALTAAQTERRAARDAVQGHEAAATEADREARKAAEALAGARGELAALEAQVARRADLGAAARKLLGAGLAGVMGVVADALEVPAELEMAVAAGLGARLQAVVVADPQAAQRALAHLAQGRDGRALLALADAHPRPQPATVPARPGVAGRLLDHLPGERPPWILALLGDVLLVNDTETALAVSARWPGPVVTREGVRCEGRVVLLAGGGGPDPSPLRRRRELVALKERVAAHASARDRAQAQADAARQGLIQGREAAELAGRAAHRAELTLSTARAEARRLAQHAEQAQARQAKVAHDLERLTGAAAEVAERVAQAEAQAVALEASRTDRAQAIEGAQAAAAEAEGARDEAVTALHQARAQKAARVERMDGLGLQRTRVERLLTDLRHRAERTRRTRAALGDRQAEARSQLAEAQGAAQGAQEAARALVAAAGRAREVEAEALAQGKTARAASQVARAAHNAAREALNEARLTLQGVRLEATHQVAQIEERFGCSVAELAATLADAPTVTADEAARLKELRALIEKMGDVNLAAIEEFGEVAERHDFLTQQRADLEAALADLARAIGRIDRTSRRLFAETFEAVNAHFRALFPRLFRGGEAELVLTEPDDLLGTGIEMLVRPPGKTVQNVALLSGGEKAMCAIALVFAVFRVRPSPFCLLDEVDAPLDDANIGRFNEVVREMAQASQVLLITHNKRTMEIADVLYGITMEESGVSKLVSVRMT
ncbi:MAG: chromosome segregation protein SMC [Myxococcales bacterium]|nr:chromosome segregation protein SMC [Myxococcales bacterium]